MKVLIIHHLEQMWNFGYKQAGTSFWKLERKFGEYLNKNKFDRVILTKFKYPFRYHTKNIGGSWEFYNDYPNIGSYIREVYEYAYGWSYDELTENPSMFVEGGNHSQAVLITDWIKELSNHEVYLSGAFMGECLEDMEIALKSQGIIPNYIKELCI